MPASINVRAATAIATAPITLGLPASSRSGSPAQWTSLGVTISTVPPPWYSGAPRRKMSRRPTRAPVPKGAYILCAESATKSMCSGSSSGLMSIRRCGASCAASTRMLAPTRCAFRARRWIGWTKPVTFEAPLTVTSAMRSPYAASSRSTSSSSSRPSGVTRARTTVARRHGRSFE